MSWLDDAQIEHSHSHTFLDVQRNQGNDLDKILIKNGLVRPYYIHPHDVKLSRKLLMRRNLRVKEEFVIPEVPPHPKFVIK